MFAIILISFLLIELKIAFNICFYFWELIKKLTLRLFLALDMLYSFIFLINFGPSLQE